jgi:hypothetical protein
MATSRNADGSRTQLAEDEAGFKRGRGWTLLGLSLAVALGLTGLWHLLSGGDDARVYGELGRKINGVRSAHFDPFWACALSGQNLHDLKNNADLTDQLDARATHDGAAYALYLRDRCADKLRPIEPALDELIIPEPLAADVTALKSATGELRSAVRAFIALLDDQAHPYDSATAKPIRDEVARGWFDFQMAHAALNKTLRAKLEKPQP